MTPIKATITYKLADLLALAAEQKAGFEQQAANVAGQKGHELIAGYSAAMAEGSAHTLAKLEAFHAAGVETVTAEHLIAEAHPNQRVMSGPDTSLSNQVRLGQIRPVTA